MRIAIELLETRAATDRKRDLPPASSRFAHGPYLGILEVWPRRRDRWRCRCGLIYHRAQMTHSTGIGAVETSEAPQARDPSGEPVVRAEGVWKVFGPHPDRVIGTPDAELSRSELQRKTGNVVAVRDVSIDIRPGEMFVVMGLSGSGKSTLMLSDEPFSALDPLIRRDMQDEVCRLQVETGKTMLFITHDLLEALRLGDRIAIMRDGAIVQLGTPEELVGSPADDYVANFVRDIPRTHVLTLRWIMRDAAPGEDTRGPELPVGTTVKDAVPLVAATDGTVRATENGRCVGVVDRETVLLAMAGGDEGAGEARPPHGGRD